MGRASAPIVLHADHFDNLSRPDFLGEYGDDLVVDRAKSASTHRTTDVIFDEDRCRLRKDESPLNLAIIRRAAFSSLKADKSKGCRAESASEPASPQSSEPAYSPLDDLGFRPFLRNHFGCPLTFFR